MQVRKQVVRLCKARCQVEKVEAILRPPRRNAVRTSVYLIQLSSVDACEKNSSSILYMNGHS